MREVVDRNPHLSPVGTVFRAIISRAFAVELDANLGRFRNLIHLRRISVGGNNTRDLPAKPENSSE
jgi:hypothetical protein